MQEFKRHVLADAISYSLISKNYVSDSWILSSSMKKDKRLRRYFGEKIYSIYNKLDKDEKIKMIDWYEHKHGEEANDLLSAFSWTELYEDEYGYDLFFFKKKDPKTYKLTIEYFIEKVYNDHKDECKCSMRKDFFDDPQNWIKMF